MSRLRPDHLPGASYRCSNLLVVAQRKVLRLRDPFKISFEQGEAGEALREWYKDLGENTYIQTMQLRKERESPFYHEFVVFRLRGGTFWRIDRRQLPDEEMPLDSIYRGGVTACDTMEEVPSLDAPLYARSDCLVELEFNVDVHIGLLLRICRAIHNHPSAKLYTLQRYNCYFFAQALTICTACGVSDWAGVGEIKRGENKSPWKSPNAAFNDFSKLSDLENNIRLTTFKWNPIDNFTHDWGQLSRLSNTLVHASPLLRHADHCNHCLESQSTHRQRSLSNEINRLKHELVEYWNREYRRVLDKAYLANHKTLVSSGVWGIVLENAARKDCKQVVQDNLEEVRMKWQNYSEDMVEKLVATVEGLLDPAEICDEWYPDPNEWSSTWTYKNGGPVEAAMKNWKEGTKAFIEAQISDLESALEVQTIEAGNKVQEAAMRARVASFSQSVSIKIRVAQNEGGLIIPEGAASTDQQSVRSGRSKRSMKTMKTMKTMLTMRAAEFKNKMRRFFGKSHKMEVADVMQMKSQIEQLIYLHAARVEQYRVLLNCTASEVETDMKLGVDQVWNYIID